MAVGAFACVALAGGTARASDTTPKLLDHTDGKDWAAYGGTYGEQHYSPLTQINDKNVKHLGLAWSMDLPPGNTSTVPIAVDGVLYFVSGLSVLRAVDATTGKLLWTHDPEVAQKTGHRMMKGARGLAYWNGKLYIGTADGRLIAVDAKTGKEVWSAKTIADNDLRYISAAPRVFNGKVIVGNGGGETTPERGYVTAYDAETGKQLWRFYTVPGNPADGFENDAMAVAAKTWAGEWWKYGGGGEVWNSITYDADQDLIFIGTGNGAPWNYRVRSLGQGDNLFLCSIVALDAKTGAYRWHYQINPAESWDYNAAMDIEMADLKIDGKLRKVVMTAPKNGFFYVIDRTNGKLISAEPIATKITWAKKIDVATGRPVEVPEARYPNKTKFEMWPGPLGAHSWQPMSYNRKTGLVYIPLNEAGAIYQDFGVTQATWTRVPNGANDVAAYADTTLKDPLQYTSALLAWNPATQKAAWKVPTPMATNSGTVSTAGNVVFQGEVTGDLKAYAADTGKLLWSFPAQAGITSAPITYEANGRQYVSLLVGIATTAALVSSQMGLSVDYYTQARRVLTFALGGKATLPPSKPYTFVAAEDPDFKQDDALAKRGAEPFGRFCIWCHGLNAKAGGSAPDLRASAVPQSAEAFANVVHDGALLDHGMPKFEFFTQDQLEAIRQYLRTQAYIARTKQVNN
jgi:quinohemoprotein ethanol dehydrogenase